MDAVSALYHYGTANLSPGDSRQSYVDLCHFECKLSRFCHGYAVPCGTVSRSSEDAWTVQRGDGTIASNMPKQALISCCLP